MNNVIQQVQMVDLKKTLLAAMLTSVLVGCGSDSNTATDENSATTTIKAIDGYLVNAEVYVDRNNNGEPEADEKLASNTGENGEIALSRSDSQYPVIVRAIAGSTYDKDKAGRLTETFELTANAGATVVTPFSTVARATNMSLTDLAARLNLPESVIDSDYTATNSEETINAHLYARSIAQRLTEDSSSLDAVSLEASLTQISTAIQGIDDADKATRYVDSNGTVQNMPPAIQSLFANKTFYVVSTNETRFSRDSGNYSRAEFTDNTLSINSGSAIDVNYVRNGFIFEEGRTTAYEEVIYASGEQLMLVIAEQGDLNLYTSTNISAGLPTENATSELFAGTGGQKLYYLFDDSSNAIPQPALVEFDFNTDGTATVREDGESERTISWSISDNKLNLFGDQVTPAFITNDMIIATVSGDAGYPHLFIKDRDLAVNLLNDWKK
ncbi:hypothetical protein [Vibrio sp. SCSIO 43137]|uniref:hypothetical protein n=1 Tax=Vibrio sp. SCSIO 43137 TaxID=3021011 RepID=UPI00230735E9|nr:hypothetical protein [Vibrio sp. SCSIO 43137]WCE28793.1 hypothetical protein PK654_10525 [Vibrio sp. SCSIO 43137]